MTGWTRAVGNRSWSTARGISTGSPQSTTGLWVSVVVSRTTINSGCPATPRAPLVSESSASAAEEALPFQRVAGCVVGDRLGVEGLGLGEYPLVQAEAGHRVEPAFQAPHAVSIHPRPQSTGAPLAFENAHAAIGLQRPHLRGEGASQPARGGGGGLARDPSRLRDEGVTDLGFGLTQHVGDGIDMTRGDLTGGHPRTQRRQRLDGRGPLQELLGTADRGARAPARVCSARVSTSASKRANRRSSPSNQARTRAADPTAASNTSDHDRIVDATDCCDERLHPTHIHTNKCTKAGSAGDHPQGGRRQLHRPPGRCPTGSVLSPSLASMAWRLDPSSRRSCTWVIDPAYTTCSTVAGRVFGPPDRRRTQRTSGREQPERPPSRRS